MKKLNKLFAILVAMAMVLSLSVSMAFAVDNDTQPGHDTPIATDGSQDDPAAVIGKYLKVAEGVTVPDATFTFTFDPKTSSTNAGGPGATVSINARNMTDVRADTTNDKAWKTSIGDLFKWTADDEEADATHKAGDYKFTAPGEYIYEVSESNNKESVTTGETLETYTNDTHKFTVRIFVKYDSNGKLVIDTITIANEQGAKLDPTEDPTDDQGEDAFDPAHPAGGTFVNNYEKKTNIPTPTTETAVLQISKTVSAKDGYVKAGQTYPFTINLVKPANSTDTATSVTAYIVKGTERREETIDYGSDTFALAHGETLVFGALPYGTTYAVEETLGDGTVENYANYQAAVVASDLATQPTANKGASLKVDGGRVTDAADDADTVAYTNTLDAQDTTPTGILMNNLPYIVLALVAIGGLVAYVVVRRRQSDEA